VDAGRAAPALDWAFPLDGRAPSELSAAVGFAGAGLGFQPRFPDPSVVERRARQPRR